MHVTIGASFSSESLTYACLPACLPVPIRPQIVTKCETHVRSLQQQHGAEIGQRDYILQVGPVVLKQ